MSKRGNSYKKVHNRRKILPGLLIGLIALVLICLVAIIGYKLYGDKTAKSEDSEFAVYDFEEYTLDSYGETSSTKVSSSGEMTRCFVNIIETPSEGGVATDPTYVSEGGSLELEVTSVSSGYRFVGWYENDKLISADEKYTLSGIKSNRVIIAKFSQKYINVTSDVEEALSNGSFRKGGGSVSGGGVLINDTSYVEIKATPDKNYTFYGWRIDNGPVEVGTKATLVVGEKATSLSPDSNRQYKNISSDTKVTAVFKQKSNFRVTLDMVPQVGNVLVTDVFDEASGFANHPDKYKEKTGPSDSKTYDSPTSEKIILFEIVYPNDKIGKEPRYKWDAFYQVMDDGSLKLYSDGRGVFPHVGAGLYVPANNTNDYHMIARLNCGDPSEVVTVGAITGAYPDYAGTVSGGGTYPQLHDFSLTADPNDEYEFVRWEWNEDGKFNTSTANPLSVRPSKIVYYKAIFAKKQYTISLASMTPMGTAEVTGLGPVSFETTDENRSKTINIKPLTDYEIESVTYTMNGNSYTAFCEKTGGNVDIPNITGDVGVYVKTMRTSGYRVTSTVDYEGWMSINASGDAVYDNPAKCTVSMKKNSEAAQTTSASTPTVYNTIDNTITLTAATTDSNLKFVRWVRSDGKVITNATETTIVVNKTDVDSDVTYVAQFEANKVTILAKVTPDGKGTVKVEKEGAIGTDINNTSVDSGSNLILTATPTEPADGGVKIDFDCWIVDSTKRKLYGEPQADGSNVLKLKNVTWNETYTAYFSNDEIDITLKVTPAGAGEVKLDDNIPIIDSGIYHDIKNGSTINLSATAENGYKFVRWESLAESGGNPVQYNEANIQIVNVKEDETYTAVFAEKNYVIKAVSSPVAGGTTYVNNMMGEVNVLPGESVTLDATPSKGYVFEYFTDSAGNRYTDDPLVLSNIQGDDTFTAHYVERELSLTINAEPPEGGTIKVNGNDFTPGNKVTIEAGDNINLEATSVNGYSFIRWETLGQNGRTPVQYSEPNIQVLNITADETYTAIFGEKNYTIKVVSSPVSGGTTYVNNKMGEVNVLPGESVTIDATPSNGYVFEYFTDSSGNKYTDNPLVLSNIQGDDTFTAYYVENEVNLTINAEPPEGGIIKVNGNDFTSGNKVSVESGSNIKLEAIPLIGYSFVRWETEGLSGTKGPTAYADSMIEVLNVTANEIYTAVFAESYYTIKVVSAPITGGQTAVSGKLDEAKFLPSEKATLSATPLEGYKFDYWTDSSGKRYTDNPLTIDVQGNETFTAHYVEGKLSITLDGAPREAGYVKFNGNRVDYGTANEIVSNSNITLSAEIIDTSKYEFERWENTRGTVYTSNPLTLLNVTESDTYTAVFNVKTGKRGIKVVASPASGGTATKTISSNGSSATLKAIPRAGYAFVKWQKNGYDFSNMAITTVNDLSDGVVYTAVFNKVADVDVRSDIIKEHFYNDRRTYTTPVYAVSRDTIQKEAEARIAKEKESQYNDSTPGLKNYQAVEEAKDIFGDIEIKEDRSALLMDSELTTTDGEVMPLSIVSDFAKEDEEAKELTLKKFGDRYSYEILTCKDVGIPDGFEDGIRTYLWKYQDVQEKDNVYILYNRNDGKYDWVSCIIDEGNTLRFTIDSIGDGCRMTVVRVIIE